MTVSVQAPVIEYIASGEATAFSYPFLLIVSSDLKVYFENILESTGYTVSGVGNAEGGTVTFAEAPAAGTRVKLLRSTPLDRTTDYVEGGALRADVLDSDIDRVVMQLQDVRADSASLVEFAALLDETRANIDNIEANAATATQAALDAEEAQTAAEAAQAAAQAAQAAAELAATIAESELFTDGSVSAPSITFASDTDTGFYRPAANQVGVAGNGTDIAKFSTWGTGDKNHYILGSAPAGFAPLISVDGPDTDVGLFFETKGAGEILFDAHTAVLAGSILTASHVNLTGKVNHSIYALSGTTPALNALNGTIQTWTLSGNSTPTDSLNNGDYVILMIDDGTAYSITWPSVTWRTNVAVLKTTGLTTVILWKVGGVLYGAW